MKNLHKLNGGAKEDRTPDPLRAKQVLSQLSYGPILMVGKTGFEPATLWSQTRCTTKLCYFPNELARQTGIEPTTS